VARDGGERTFGRWTGAAITWLAVCGLAVATAVLGLLSVERLRSPVEIEGAYVALVVGQAFFLIFLWPLFERGRRNGAWRDAAGLDVRLVALLALCVPFVLIARRTATVPFAVVARSQGLVVLLGLAAGIAARLPGARVWYYPGAFVLSAGVPLAGYLLHEEGGVSLAWAASVSPLWAAGATAAGTASPAPLIVFGGLACGALLCLALIRTSPSEHR